MWRIIPSNKDAALCQVRLEATPNSNSPGSKQVEEGLVQGAMDDWEQQDEQRQRFEGAQFPVNLFLGLYVIVAITSALEMSMLLTEPVAKQLAQLRSDMEEQNLKLDRDLQKNGKLLGHSECL
eukprot:CAMPEP_0202892566 /NCGR_PEP_ID=MMETSP1392-20130828/2283_1 /ASSEMBLY_ACC=CAM_ASM_000868 /TAXON_ID=225041 /ORGANISM="Chlamydomonas chlamydogama, Strain SAG 11-48b" /LENGTH=122 /DNA_ID=CAMNT_0049576569 /DNA_START=173 /DNA_END=542 /DNA_ORIENTATION=-